VTVKLRNFSYNVVVYIFFPMRCFVFLSLHKDINNTISYFFRFVIDCGYVKQRQYNPSSGMYSLDVVQISRYIIWHMQSLLFMHFVHYHITSIHMSSFGC